MEERKRIGEEELFELIDRDKNNKVDFKEIESFCQESRLFFCGNLGSFGKAVHRKEEWNTSELVKSLSFPILKHHIRNNKFQVQNFEDHTFISVGGPVEELRRRIQHINEQKKFVCFNDDTHPSSPDFQAIRQTICQFYEFKFPEKSSFEL